MSGEPNGVEHRLTQVETLVKEIKDDIKGLKTWVLAILGSLIVAIVGLIMKGILE